MPSFRDDIVIDRDALDKEWVQLPALYYDYSHNECDAREKVNQLVLAKDVANARCKRTYAEIAISVRNNPEYYRLAKVTETSVDHAVLVSQAYIEAQAAYVATCKKLAEAQNELELLSTAKWALEMKKKALEGLTQLWVSNYFVDRSENKPLQEAAGARSAVRQQETINRRMNKRTRVQDQED